MDNHINRKTVLLGAAVAFGSLIVTLDAINSPHFSLVTVNTAHAQGHDSGSTGGHDSGSTGGHDSGSTGGHSGGGGGHSDGGGPGEGTKGHGTRYRHQGHSGGQHGAASPHQAGADQFGGGSGARGNSQVPEGVGRYGQGALSADSDQGRLRYWGGWTLPDDPQTPDTLVITTSTLVPGSGSGPSVNPRNALDSATRCEGVTSGMAPAQQFAGGNLLRLNAARGLVDPELAASGKIASPFLMGSFQDEMTKAAPDTELAGTYLGLIAKTPVTADTVKKIGFQLCASVGDAQAQEIAEVAEAQRATIAAEAAKP